MIKKRNQDCQKGWELGLGRLDFYNLKHRIAHKSVYVKNNTIFQSLL